MVSVTSATPTTTHITTYLYNDFMLYNDSDKNAKDDRASCRA